MNGLSCRTHIKDTLATSAVLLWQQELRHPVVNGCKTELAELFNQALVFKQVNYVHVRAASPSCAQLLNGITFTGLHHTADNSMRLSFACAGGAAVADPGSPQCQGGRGHCPRLFDTFGIHLPLAAQLLPEPAAPQHRRVEPAGVHLRTHPCSGDPCAPSLNSTTLLLFCHCGFRRLTMYTIIGHPGTLVCRGSRSPTSTITVSCDQEATPPACTLTMGRTSSSRCVRCLVAQAAAVVLGVMSACH